MPSTTTSQNGSHHEASPSPPPPAPVPLTPGPRASRLEKVYTEALSRTLRANSYANFSACFPTPAKYVPASLESVWRQLNAKLEESAKAEFDEIMREKDAVRGLNELDRLVGEAKLRMENGEEGSVVGPHTLGAEELYKAHLAPYLRDAQDALNEKLEATQAQNAELAEKIRQQRLEIESLLSGLEAIVADVEGAATATAQYSKENSLREEVVKMDEEVRARQDV
ncbi:hypothetical protein DTO166G4_3495 [Paecilomyces variotii]|nr:hypothetical protein DTO166G4_3495 [Paecilomyces variotii]KAJ9238417.1 hypothetical protein DTO166G5_2965 [Paecilomyces variotii]KAJ9270274.1 hypothetical protein DTO212C5_3768 [Paecilomyces variotii]KAJ9394180.1 hypothetical protein DTO282F9_8897 [Paecilomyces variotii]